MSKRMFELVEGTSSKFWEVWVEGDEVHTRYGRIGAAGQTTVKDEGSAEKAQKLHDKLVAEKTKKGYVEKGAAAKAAPAKAEKAEKAAAAPAFDAKKYAARIAKIEANAKKAGYTLPKGANEKAIAKAEAALGFTFPPEVRAFYLAHDGGSDDGDYICAGRELLSLEGIVGQWKIWKDLFDKGEFEDAEGDVDAGVQEAWWIPAWIPVTYDGSGNHDIIDLAPAEGGKVGQILSFYHDDDPRTIVGPDLLTWLEKVKWGEDFDEEDDEESEGAWRRFEMDEKFWAIKLDGASFTVKYGKIGTEGQEKTKDFDDEDAAKNEYDKLVAEKTKKGYEEAEGDG
jgi:predicted DNA-binding WGR domain protein/cell wall assembly regulator SMI1